MKRPYLAKLAACLTVALAAGPASAGYNATASGTVNFIQQMSTSLPGYTPGTFVFSISGQPALSCGSGFNYFVVSPNSNTDADARKHILALLMLAKATGLNVVVGYDSASAPGNSCDQGYPIVYWLETN